MKIVLYAHDTIIFTFGDSEDQCRDNIMEDVIKFNIWLKMRKKTKIKEIYEQ